MKSDVFVKIKAEKARQEQTINLIASENYCSQNVMSATGSVLTNKYAEGYPGARYYGGCEVIDEIENFAIDNCKKLFNAEHANVQPHSGSTANMAVYFSFLNSGDTVLGMSLSSGGHLTHGHKVNFSGKLFNFVSYGVSPETEQIDYDEVEIMVQQHKPKMIVAGASAYSRAIDFERFHKIAKNNNALLFVDMAHIAGLVAAGIHQNPMPFADVVSSTTHKTLRGPRGGIICCKSDFAQKIDKSVMPGCQGGPLMHVIAAKAVAFEEALTDEFKTYQQQVVKNSQAMAGAFKDLGYRIVAGGTDTHLFLIDLKGSEHAGNGLTGKSITGKEVEEALQKCNIVLNRNTIPFDKESPFITSGIRIGTPAITTRGFKEKDVLQVVQWVHEAITKRNDDQFLSKLKGKVIEVCKKFPIYR